jgi:DNA-3-methyladenine glycosylase
MYECLNVVTEPEGRAAAVLIRAVEPVEGEAAMREARLAHALRRARTEADRERIGHRVRALAPARLASGPGLVAAALDISRTETGTDLLDPDATLRIEPGRPVASVVTTPRVGIGYAPEPWRSNPWRLFDAGSSATSAR